MNEEREIYKNKCKHYSAPFDWCRRYNKYCNGKCQRMYNYDFNNALKQDQNEQKDKV